MYASLLLLLTTPYVLLLSFVKILLLLNIFLTFLCWLEAPTVYILERGLSVLGDRYICPGHKFKTHSTNLNAFPNNQAKIF